jgi:RNA polymerase sigma factor (sigma-70 family)
MADHDSASSTRPSLLLRIRDGRDDDAWAAFLETYAPLVYRYCRRRGVQDADAEDVTQEVMAQVAHSVRSFDYRPDRGRFRDWLGAVTHSKLANRLRSDRRAPRAAGGGPDDAPEPADAADPGPEWAEEFHAQGLRVALERARAGFEPTTWRAFERVWIVDRPAAEVAGELGMTLVAVYLAKSRVLKRLREEVRALAEDEPLFVPLR